MKSSKVPVYSKNGQLSTNRVSFNTLHEINMKENAVINIILLASAKRSVELVMNDIKSSIFGASNCNFQQFFPIEFIGEIWENSLAASKQPPELLSNNKTALITKTSI